MHRLESLNQAFASGKISWADWAAETDPILRILNPELHPAPRPVTVPAEVEAPVEPMLDESRVLIEAA